MPIIGFNFDKFNVVKLKPLEPPIQVESGMKILDVKKEEITLGNDQKDNVLRFDYEFSVKYTPKQADILIEGHILFAEEKKKMDKIFDDWKKTKKFNADVTQLVMNNVLLRCNIKALLLGQEIGLPPHIRLPMVQQAPKGKKTKAEKKAEEYIG